MILTIDTSTPVCKITFIDGDKKYEDSWQADRTLALGLLKRINDFMSKYDLVWSDLTGLGVFEGPGSFTGLRIGLTVLNTIADSENIPIVGAQGDDWQDEIVSKLNSGKNEKMIIPHHGSEARITKPTK